MVSRVVVRATRRRVERRTIVVRGWVERERTVRAGRGDRKPTRNPDSGRDVERRSRASTTTLRTDRDRSHRPLYEGTGEQPRRDARDGADVRCCVSCSQAPSHGYDETGVRAATGRMRGMGTA
ncbi:hypothetical protein BRC68_17550 [Halobacteriales archaeon QH_6_64_20]|nr:MAG: hypothetical protein BRC68_17550 [Halobacteriales archaeon QH_6_64_20]